MNKHTVKIYLHPSIPSTNRLLEGDVNHDTILLDALISIISTERDVLDQLVYENEIRPGYLIISNKVELRTTKQLNNKISYDMEIKIIPISHGG